MQADLIDRIYECSFVPELWPDVLSEVASLAQGEGGLLFAARDRVLQWTASDSLSEIFQDYVAGGWFARCSRRVCIFNQSEPGFFVEHDFWTPAQIDENPIYRDFFRPRGLGWSAGTGLQMPTGDNIVFSVERAFNRGPVGAEVVQKLNALRPHLARAALIAARIGLRAAKGANDTLAVLGLPALVMDESGVVVEANALMNEQVGVVHWRAQDRIVLTDKEANALLWSALNTPADGAIRSFAVRGKDGMAALVGHVVPVRRSAHDVFGRAYALLVLTPVTTRKAPPVELLRSLFDLTPSEARVARGLAKGESIDAIAEVGGVSRNTVRVQLQQVLAKTGCSRQAELTALLSNVAIADDVVVLQV